ncbi:MAG: hypothetical protein LBO74_12995 [Candidatus Symbiothrix sp.]|jgi:hypothetical protein|nr:hypothetical protein [Candidatus Symbiothrix sp.]
MKNRLFIVLTAIILLPAGLRAQVTIGGVNDPTNGAILDLNSTVKGGLILPNVKITDLSKLPTGEDGLAGIAAGTDDDTNTDLTGTIVYNTNEVNGITKGVYAWTGTDWVTAMGKTTPTPPEGCECGVGPDNYLYLLTKVEGGACPDATWTIPPISQLFPTISAVEMLAALGVTTITIHDPSVGWYQSGSTMDGYPRMYRNNYTFTSDGGYTVGQSFYFGGGGRTAPVLKQVCRKPL